MRSHSLLCFIPCFLTACSPRPLTPGGPQTPVNCTVTSNPELPEVSEGGRLQLDVATSEAVLGWELVEADSFQATKVGNGLQLKAPYGSPGEHKLVVSVDCETVHATAELKVSVRPLSWSPVTTWTEEVDGPLSREYASIWLDEKDSDRLLLFGGFLYEPKQFTPSWELWELSLATGKWKALAPATEAPHFTGGRVALIPGTREALYLGGIDEAGNAPYQLSRLFYAPDKLSWHSEPTVENTGRGDYQPGFFYDAKRDRFLSVCGVNDDVGYHCALREFKPNAAGGAWQVVEVAGTAPKGRNGHFYAYDAETDRLVMFGGDRNGVTLGDTWMLELNESPPRWVSYGDDPSMRRRNGAFALDPVNHRFIIWGGTATGATSSPQVWAFDLDRGQEAWVRVITSNPPPPRTSATAVYDAERNRIIAGFGNSEIALYPDLWSLQL
jgi:hypothetical protein